MNAVTGLSPNDVHTSRLPCLPLFVFEPDETSAVTRAWSATRPHIHQPRHRPKTTRVLPRQRALPLHHLASATPKRLHYGRPLSFPFFHCRELGLGVQLRPHHTQGCSKRHVPTTKLALNWHRPSRALAVGPTPACDTPDNRPLQDKLLFLDLSSDLPGRDCNPRVSIKRGNPCRSHKQNTTDFLK